MIEIKSPKEIEIMREAGRISATALQLAGTLVRPGMNTKEIDRQVEAYIRSQGATPNFLGYGGFPGSACISLNDQVIHGIPSSGCVIQEGDIVSVDTGAEYRGFHGDNAATFGAGRVSETAQRLMDVTRESLMYALTFLKPGARLGDVSHAVQAYVEKNGFSVVKQYVGHGIGRKLHEPPDVPNYGKAGFGLRLAQGMTFAIEPMVNEKTDDVKVLADGWTVVTADGGLSAHFEHTALVTQDGYAILTLPDSL